MTESFLLDSWICCESPVRTGSFPSEVIAHQLYLRHQHWPAGQQMTASASSCFSSIKKVFKVSLRFLSPVFVWRTINLFYFFAWVCLLLSFLFFAHPCYYRLSNLWLLLLLLLIQVVYNTEWYFILPREMTLIWPWYVSENVHIKLPLRSPLTLPRFIYQFQLNLAERTAFAIERERWRWERMLRTLCCRGEAEGLWCSWKGRTTPVGVKGRGKVGVHW